MKIGFHIKLKEYFWRSIKKVTNNYTNFKVNNLGNGYIKCIWQISPIDNFRIELSKSCFIAIRLFDITNNRVIDKSTCIMKEIQVSKFQSCLSFPIPINKGMYYFELGYRKKNGYWRKLASKDINLGFTINKGLDCFDSDDWFNSKNISGDASSSLHEEAYQLSFNSYIGGSETIFSDRKGL